MYQYSVTYIFDIFKYLSEFDLCAEGHSQFSILNSPLFIEHLIEQYV